jgi:Secretion system C-terminal sorting domain
MKKNILKIIILLIANIGFSQGNSNYIDQTSEWRSYRGGWGESIYSTFYIDGTETLNGNIYYKTYRNDHKIETNIYFGGTTITDATFGPGYLREINGQFLFYNITDNTEFVWFNNQTLMNSQIGDTYSFQNTNCTVESISSNLLGSVPLKRITGVNTIGYTGAIEGIGEIGAVCSAGFEYSSYLTCYTKQGNTIQFGNLDCNLFPNPIRVNLSTISNSLSENELSIFPNPTNGVLKVKNKLLKENYKIYDIRGVLIKEGIFENELETIDISNNLNGIYILKIVNGNSIVNKKIVKE